MKKNISLIIEVDIKDLKPMTKVSSITELQERLKKSIDDLRAKRKAQNNNAIHSRDELLKKRLKRKRDRKEQIQKKKEKRRKTNDMVGMDIPEGQATEVCFFFFFFFFYLHYYLSNIHINIKSPNIIYIYLFKF